MANEPTIYISGFEIEIPDQYITLIESKKKKSSTPYIKYPGLLRVGHKTADKFDGFLSVLKHKIIEIPSKENNFRSTIKVLVAIVSKEDHNKVLMQAWGTGDADPNSVGIQIKPHIIRQSETRAMARALRIITDVGMTALEELDSFENAPEEQPEQGRVIDTKEQERNDLEAQLKKLAIDKGMTGKALLNSIGAELGREVKSIDDLANKEISDFITDSKGGAGKNIKTEKSKPATDIPEETDDQKLRAEYIEQCKSVIKGRNINLVAVIKESFELKDGQTSSDLTTNQLGELVDILKQKVEKA